MKTSFPHRTAENASCPHATDGRRGRQPLPARSRTLRRAVGRPGFGSSTIVCVLVAAVVSWSGCDSEPQRSANVETRLAKLERKVAELEKRQAQTRPAGPQPKAAQPEKRVAANQETQTPPQGPPKEVVTERGTGPRIKVEQASHDFGTTMGPLKLKHTFTITNAGDAPLEITKVSPGCGCTIAGAYPKKLEPGESGGLPFTLDTRRVHNRYAKSISVFSNDPAKPQLRLMLRGESKMYVGVSPTAAYFGTVYGDEPKERVIKITNNTDDPLKLSLDAPGADGKFKFDLVEKKAGQQFELHVATVPPYTSGIVQATATLKTNVEAQKTVAIRVHARVPERLDVYPNTILPRKRGGAGGFTGFTRLTNYGETPVNVLKATVNDPNVDATVDELVPGKTFKITVQVPSDADLPAAGRTLTLKTDDAERPTIQVSIRPPAGQTRAPTNRNARKGAAKPKRKPALDLVDKPAPKLALKTLQGKSVSSDDFAGSPATVLNFFAADCGFCKKQIPKLEAVRAEYTEKGVRFVNVGQTMRKTFTDEQVAELMKSLGSHLELAHDPSNRVGKAFKVTSFPTMFVVGKDGKVKHVNFGNKTDLNRILKRQLDAMLGGKPPGGAASAPAGSSYAG